MRQLPGDNSGFDKKSLPADHANSRRARDNGNILATLGVHKGQRGESVRLTKFPIRVFLLLIALAFSASCLRAQATDAPSAGQGGTAPRSSADKYHAHAMHAGVSIGAELLTRKEVSKEFVVNVNQCCLLVRVAVYPQKDEPLSVFMDDFTLIEGGTDTPVRPQSPTVISARLEKEKDSNSGVTASTSAGVGYESGTYTDPATGQPVRVHGVSTSASVAVGVGESVPADVAERDREVIERELSEKGLPEGRTAIPVSGYLYFYLPKQKKDAKYRLEYVVKGETLRLQLP
jgi:hypothetical protein